MIRHGTTDGRLCDRSQTHNATSNTLGRVAGTVHSSAASRNEFQRAHLWYVIVATTFTGVAHYGSSIIDVEHVKNPGHTQPQFKASPLGSFKQIRAA